MIPYNTLDVEDLDNDESLNLFPERNKVFTNNFIIARKNHPIIDKVIVEEPTGFQLDMMTLVLIIIPVAIGGGLFLLKRMDKLDLITDKIPIGNKLEEPKERISDVRNRQP